MWCMKFGIWAVQITYVHKYKCCYCHLLPARPPSVGCPCNATAQAASFRCPAGSRCSRLAYQGLSSSVLEDDTAALLQAVCTPCEDGQYCAEGTYLQAEVGSSRQLQSCMTGGGSGISRHGHAWRRPEAATHSKMLGLCDPEPLNPATLCTHRML